MRFTELVLHNVGVYTGRQAIDLRTQPDKPVILIGGLNGCGKTTFLDAIQLVLYGRRARLSNRGNTSWDSFLLQTISRSMDPTEGAAIELKFEVEMDGATRQYDVTRTWRSTGRGVREIVTVFVDGKTSPSLSSGWAEHVEELLPLDIASLFFFDGEKIESLADTETASNVIRTAVHSLLGIGTIEQLATDLLALQRRQKPAIADAAGDEKVRVEAARLRALETELDIATQRLGEVETRWREAATALSRAELAFERDGGKLYESRTALELERRHTVSQVEDSESQLRALAEGALPLLLVLTLFSDLRRQDSKDAETLKARQLSSLLASRDRRLIRLLSESARAELLPLLEADSQKLANKSRRPLRASLSPEAREQLMTIHEDLGRARGSAELLVAKIDDLRARRDELETALAGVPSTELIGQRLSDRDTARLASARVQGERDALMQDVTRLRTSIDGTRRALDVAEAERRAGVIHVDEVRRVLEHTDRVRETLAQLRTRLIARNLGKLEVATLDSFRALMRKHRPVEDLRIDPEDFSVHLLGRSGQELPASRLSAGERQLLAVALLWGIAKVAGHRLPTVVDTPLGRLDSKHRERLVERYFPNAGSQVLLLSTDEEIDAGLFAKLEPSVSSTYLLSHDDEAHLTRIVPGYWWSTKESHVA